MDNKKIEVSLEKLSEVEGLSTRSKNICEWNDLEDIFSILEYYWENRNFLKLRNCGHNSNKELINICFKYEKKIIKPETSKIQEYYACLKLDTIEVLTKRQKQIINIIIESQFNELSNRSMNALIFYLGNDISLKSIKLILMFPDLEIKKIQKISEKEITEIKGFIFSIKDLIKVVSNFKNEDILKIELFNTYLTRKFLLSPQIIAEIGNNYNFSNGLPIFKTIKVLIENEIIFDHKENEIFISGFNYFNDSVAYVLEKQADKLEVTRERIRQIRVNIFENLFNKFSFLKSLEFDALNLYGLDYTGDYVAIDETFVEEINNSEATNFNAIFINKILSVLFIDRYTLIGNEEGIVFNKNSCIAHNWKCTYLVLTDYATNFDFVEFIDDVSFRLSLTIDEGYSFHFEAYLLKFKRKYYQDQFENITKTAEYILFKEFELSIDSDENIVFNRNTKKQTIDYVYEVLEEKCKPLTLYEIYDIIENKNPGVVKSVQALRGCCQRDSNMIFFGRSSTYGLKSWEDELNIKGGTIRNIVEEYLQSQIEPKHIDEITKYVNMYRDTNRVNIYSSLKSDTRKTFIFFSGAYFGLRDKNYTFNNFIETKNVSTPVRDWRENYGLLEKFASENNRLPFHNASEHEKKLYNFLNSQKGKHKKGKLSLIQQQLLESIGVIFKKNFV